MLLLPILVLLAAICLALGVTLPLVHVDRLFVFSEEPSLIEMIAALWGAGDPWLAVIIAAFSIVFPVVKLALLALAASPRNKVRIPTWTRALGNWSMLDVVLVALVIFAAKTSGLATASTKPGLWFFALSAVLTALAASWSKKVVSGGRSAQV